MAAFITSRIHIISQVNNIKFSSEVADICVNKRVICVAFRERVAIFDALSLRDKVTKSSSYSLFA